MIPFGDLKREYRELKPHLDAAVRGVCESGWFVLGGKVEQFESAFARYAGGGVHAIGVGSGTDALYLSLVSCGVGHGDYVITVPNTAVPTISAISLAGAAPVFVDVDPVSFNMDPALLRQTIKREKARLGVRLKAVMPVHLYGQCADMDPILETAREYGLKVVEDACQAHGALYKGRMAGTMGDYGAFSFYPSKNLGAYGDGGAVLTGDLDGARRLVMLRNYGQRKRYYHKIIGINSRLDEMQAAILLAKLGLLDVWNRRRRAIAGFYSRAITNSRVTKPSVMPYGGHVFHLYVIRHPDRDALVGRLRDGGVGTAIHYPVPVHLQEAYAELGYGEGSFPASERLAGEIVSLPVFPQLSDEELAGVADVVNGFEA